MSLDLKKLRELAMAATAGPWEAWNDFVHCEGTDWEGQPLGLLFHAEQRGKDPGDQDERNAAFVATFNPALVLELLGELERLGVEVAKARTWSNLEAEVERLQGEVAKRNEQSLIVENLHKDTPSQVGGNNGEEMSPQHKQKLWADIGQVLTFFGVLSVFIWVLSSYLHLSWEADKSKYLRECLSALKRTETTQPLLECADQARYR